MRKVARLLVAVVAILALVGIGLLVASRGIEELPGNIVVQRERSELHIPVGVMVAVSVVLTVLLHTIPRRQ